MDEVASRPWSTGLGIGLTFGVLEVLLGSDLGSLLKESGARTADLHLALTILVTDIVLSTFLALCVSGIQFAIPKLRMIDSRAATASLVSTFFLITLLLHRAETLDSLWEKWLGLLTLGALLYGLGLGAALQRFARHSYSEQNPLGTLGIFGFLSYGFIWLGMVGLDAVRDVNGFPWLSGLLGGAGLIGLLACASISGIAARRFSLAIFAFGLIAFVWTVLPTSNLAPVSGAPIESPQKPAPSVILIVLDTLRADHLSVYGYERATSPQLMKFAQGADVFERCLSTSSWTVPAHASLLTGLYPSSHGVHLSPESGSADLLLADELWTLSEAFRDSGYRTGAAVANTWLKRGSGFDQGFDWYDDKPRHNMGLEPWVWSLSHQLTNVLPKETPFLDTFLARLWPYFTPYPSFTELAYASTRWIQQEPEQPFFLFMNAMEAHDPFEPPPPERDRWPGRIPGRISFHQFQTDVMSGRTPLDPVVLEHIISQYDGEIAYLDRQLGDFFAELRRIGWFDASWIIVTADHGEHLGEHGLLWHRTSLYDPLLRVPLIVKRPGQTQGRRVSNLIQLTDVMPTLLASYGIQMPNDMDSAGLWQEQKQGLAELYYDRWIVQTHGTRAEHNQFVFERDGHKLVTSSRDPASLYKIATDPSEQHDVSLEVPGLLRELNEERERLVDSLPPPPHARREAGPDADTLRRLRSLGYMD